MISIEEFQKNNREIIKRVEGGEKIKVTNGRETIRLETNEEIMYRIHTDHNDGPWLLIKFFL